MTPRAVSVGQLQHLSASQLNTWSLCHRRWWFEKVALFPVPEEPDSPASLGLAVHRQMERYYRGGPVPEHPSAALLVESGRIPTRGRANLRVEYPDNFKLGIEVSGIPIHGKIDLLELHQDLDDDSLADIWDWKTKKDLKWALTAEGLERDVQMMLYGKYAMEVLSAETVSFHHANLRREGPAAYSIVSTGCLGFYEVENFVDSVVAPIVDRVKLDAGADDFHDVTPNFKACYEYGKPCPFIDKCAENASVHMSMLFKGEGDGMESLTTKLTASATSSTRPELGLALYINAIPVKGVAGVTFLDDIIGAASADICGAKKVLDLRMLPYGEGKALLAAGLRQHPPTGVVVATTGEMSDVAIEALLPLATVVVRGTR